MTIHHKNLIYIFCLGLMSAEEFSPTQVLFWLFSDCSDRFSTLLWHVFLLSSVDFLERQINDRSSADILIPFLQRRAKVAAPCKWEPQLPSSGGSFPLPYHHRWHSIKCFCTLQHGLREMMRNVPAPMDWESDPSSDPKHTEACEHMRSTLLRWNPEI